MKKTINQNWNNLRVEVTFKEESIKKDKKKTLKLNNKKSFDAQPPNHFHIIPVRIKV